MTTLPSDASSSPTAFSSSKNEFHGIIIPPPDVRSIIDKTAQFVAKNGVEFEQRVRLDKGSERKFSFLSRGNPYKAYYDAKVKEFVTGEVTEAAHPQVPQAILEIRRKELEKQEKKKQLFALTSYATGSNATETTESFNLLQIRDAQNLQTQGSKFLAIDSGRPAEAPTEDRFTATRPFAAALDIDVIKLTAQYVARNGQRFLAGLSQRERGNAQFAFLRATHSLFAFFTALVDAYARCLVPDKAVINRLKENIGMSTRCDTAVEKRQFVSFTDLLTGPKRIPEIQLTAALSIFDCILARLRWEEHEEHQKQEKAKEEAEEREQMHALDWHDFVVVEVIEFTNEDEALALLPPIDMSQLIQPTLIAPLATPRDMDTLPEASPSLVATEELPTLEMTASHPMAQHGSHQNAQPLQAPLPPMSTFQQHQGGFSDAPPEMAAPVSVPIMIVSDYVRQPKKRNRLSEKMMKCPITGQWIPSAEMTEHLRILLLDPKWKEEKDALLAKAQKGSTFAADSDFETNLANFVVKRPDLFGSVDDECESAYIPVSKRK